MKRKETRAAARRIYRRRRRLATAPWEGIVSGLRVVDLDLEERPALVGCGRSL